MFDGNDAFVNNQDSINHPKSCQIVIVFLRTKTDFLNDECFLVQKQIDECFCVQKQIFREEKEETKVFLWTETPELFPQLVFLSMKTHLSLKKRPTKTPKHVFVGGE